MTANTAHAPSEPATEPSRPLRANRRPHTVAWLGLLVFSALLAACSPRQLLVQGMADALASQGQADEEDLGLARDAAPFYLKLSESLLKETPGHPGLALAVASGFTQYAYAFVAFEAEKRAASDARSAHALNERARRLYLRAHRHAMAALEASEPGLRSRLMAAGQPPGGQLRAGQVALAYWAAASWAASIALSKDDADAVADLPAAVRLATWAWDADPRHDAGGLASLMGSLEAARPGGSPTRAAAYFDQAIALGAERQAGPYVAKAEAIAQPSGDRAAFERLLRQALAASADRHDMPNQVMQARARWLLGMADDLF